MEVLVERDGAIECIAFNRPDKKNAITGAMYEAAARAVREAESDERVNVILFHGMGGAFTAGNDLADFVERPPGERSAPVWRFIDAIVAGTKPLVAAVQGSAVGIGTTLLLHCDLVYASTDARFALPFVRLGLVPEFASSYLLPLAAGHARAAELLLLGEPFDANAALAAGIVTRVVQGDAVHDTAREAARKLAALPPLSVRRTRELMKRPRMKEIGAQLDAEAAYFGPMLGEPAARAAFAAFLARKKV